MNLTSFTSRRGIIFAAFLLAGSLGCSRSGGSRFNGENGDSINVPAPPSQAPTVTTLNVLGGINTVTGAVNDTVSPFLAPVQFSYVLADTESEPLSLLVEFARAATPTQFQAATLLGATNPLTNLQAINYQDPNSVVNNFTWDATTDLGANAAALTETVQFRITPSDAANTGASQIVTGGVSFAFPAPPNNPPSITTLAVAGTGQLSGQVTFNYTVADADNDNLTLSVFFIGPPSTPGGPPPAPKPMTLIQVNGNPSTPVAGTPVNATNPNVLASLAPAQFTGTFVWDSLTDIGVSAFQNFTFQGQITDGIDAGANVTTPTISVGNPTAAFAQNLSVIGRSGNINLGLGVFDSDSDLVTVSFEITFNGTDFIPMSITGASSGTIAGNGITGVASSPAGVGLALTWTSTQDIPIGVTSGMIRVTVVDDDRAVTVPTTLPNQVSNPTAPPLPNLFVHGGSAGFPSGTLFLLSPSITLAGAPRIVAISSPDSISNPFYAPTLARSGTFTIEGENFGTDETLVSIFVNNLSIDVVEADSNVILASLVQNVTTGLVSVTVNGVTSNAIPVLISGNDYWSDTTIVTADDQSSLPTIVDPSVHGHFTDLDGDGDLDIVVAQDGANSILINQDFNDKLSALNPGPYTITATTNLFDLYLVKSAINRNRGPYNVNQLDQLAIATIRQSTGPNAAVTVVNTSNSAQGAASLVPSGQTFVQTSAGYVAGLANQSGTTNTIGSGRHFNASVLNRRHLEIFPTLPFDQLAIFESSTSTFPNRRPLGFRSVYRQGYGSTGTDLLVVAGAGPFNIGDIFTSNGVSSTIVRVADNGNGTFNIDVLAQRGFAVNQTIINQLGTAGTVQSISRNPTVPLGGRTMALSLPTGSLTATSLATLLNNAAIAAGLDVPGLTTNLLVPTTAGFAIGTTVTNQLGSTGTVITIADNSLLRLQSTNSFNVADSLIVGGATVTTVTRVLETRTDFVARTSNSGLTLDIFSKDVVVIGNGTANQALGFISQRVNSLQQPDASGNYTFPAEFQNLQLSIGDGTNSGFVPVTVPLTGTMSIASVVTAINDLGLAARLGGNNAAGLFEASLVSQTDLSGATRQSIEIRTGDPTQSIHVLDQGAQRVLGFAGRFIKPHARGLGNYVDETGARLPGQSNDFSTKIESLDADEDGDPDFFITNALAQNRLLISTNTGIFTDQTTTLLPTLLDESFAAISGDLDNDGDLDIAIANRGRNRVLENRSGELDPNNGNQPFPNGTMTERTFTVFPINVDASLNKFSSDTAIIDVDGDGRNDIIMSNLVRGDNLDGPRIFFNQNITFGNSLAANPKFIQSSLVYKDDGVATTVELVKNSFLKQAVFANKNNFSVAVGDINADGRVDIVLGNERQGTFNFNNGAFIQSTTTVTITPGPVRFFKNQSIFLSTDVGSAAGLTVREIVRDFPSAGQDTLVLDNGANLNLFTNTIPFPANANLFTRTIDAIPNATTIRVSDLNGSNIFKVGDVLQGEQSGTIETIITIANDPADPNFDLITVSNTGGDFTVGERIRTLSITKNPQPFSRIIATIPAPDPATNNRNFLIVTNSALDLNQFVAGDVIRGMTSGAQTTIIAVEDDVVDFDRLEVIDNTIFTLNETIVEVPATGTIARFGLTVFATRTQAPPYPHITVPNISDTFQQIFDYPETFDAVNNVLDHRASDSTKDIALGEFNGIGLAAIRTPQSVTGLVEGTSSPLGGGGTTFARFVVAANAQDRSDTPFKVGNLLFVINNSTGQKNSLSDVSTPFVCTPFINNDEANLRHHMPIDTVESFGVDFGDIDNDGDLDLIFFNGGGQGAGAQNLLYNANIQPGNLTNFNPPYP
jgi:hypothetical protein